jgi:hypothetical protein
MACTIWSATMTGHGDYESFVVSRFFACLTGSVAIAGKNTPARLMNIVRKLIRHGSWIELYHGHLLLARTWQGLCRLRSYLVDRVSLLGRTTTRTQLT